jgi:hypothetical protein
MPLLEKYIFVKKSGLPNTGKGLFTKIAIKKGVRIVEYKGRLQSWKEVKAEDGFNGYLMYIHGNAVINALPAVKTLGRYANDAMGIIQIEGLRNNSEYVSEGNRCYIEAIKNIKPGEEILVGYGREYWNLIRKIIKEKYEASWEK